MGDPAALSRPKTAGAQPVRDRENNMREDTYSAAYAPERAAVSTTNVIMCGAAGITACRNTLTKDLAQNPALCQGITQTRTMNAPKDTNVRMAKVRCTARA